MRFTLSNVAFSLFYSSLTAQLTSGYIFRSQVLYKMGCISMKTTQIQSKMESGKRRDNDDDIHSYISNKKPQILSKYMQLSLSCFQFSEN